MYQPDSQLTSQRQRPMMTAQLLQSQQPDEIQQVSVSKQRPKRRTAGCCAEESYCSSCAHFHEARERHKTRLANQTKTRSHEYDDYSHSDRQRVSPQQRQRPEEREEKRSDREFRRGRPIEATIQRKHANPLTLAPRLGVLKMGNTKKSKPGGDTVRFASTVESRSSDELKHEPTFREGVQTTLGSYLFSDNDSTEDDMAISSAYLNGLTTYLFLIGSFIWLWYLMPRSPPPNYFPYYYDQRFL